jgi:S-(hydroxymethyl)glutathione dehydrogenase/alcohol dehydrogenase
MCCRVVESVGEDVDEVTDGDTIIPSFVSDCGECVDCKSEKSNLYMFKTPFQNISLDAKI